MSSESEDIELNKVDFTDEWDKLTNLTQFILTNIVGG